MLSHFLGFTIFSGERFLPKQRAIGDVSSSRVSIWATASKPKNDIPWYSLVHFLGSLKKIPVYLGSIISIYSKSLNFLSLLIWPKTLCRPGGVATLTLIQRGVVESMGTTYHTLQTLSRGEILPVTNMRRFFIFPDGSMGSFVWSDCFLFERIRWKTFVWCNLHQVKHLIFFLIFESPKCSKVQELFFRWRHLAIWKWYRRAAARFLWQRWLGLRQSWRPTCCAKPSALCSCGPCCPKGNTPRRS